MAVVRLSGRGRVVLPAYGVADAEHQVEKELTRLFPGARVRLLEVARTGDQAAIVEEFAVAYALVGSVQSSEEDEAEARRAALRMLRERFAGTRFERVRFDPGH